MHNLDSPSIATYVDTHRQCGKVFSECTTGPNTGFTTHCILPINHEGRCTNALKPLTFEEFPYAGESPTILPTDPKERKGVPIVSGVLDYFPAALAEVARVSKAGNDQHNPGQPLHWSRDKSGDHADCAGRHLIERGGRDSDGQRHTAKLAWRALALLEEELEAEGAPISRGSK